MPGHLTALHGLSSCIQAMSRAYGSLDLVARSDPESWRGSLQVLRLGTLQISTEESDAVRVVRTPRGVAADGHDHVFARLQLDGHARLFQDGRSTDLCPGVLAFYDASRPFDLVLPEHQRARVLMVPRPLLRLGEAEIRRVTAKVIGDAPEGPATLLLPLLSGLAREIGVSAPAAREELARAVADLLATLAADRLATTEPAEARAATLFDRVKATIETRLGEAELSPQALADAHGVSLRYLHKLFHEHDTTVGGWIRRRRLESCRAELARPTAADRTIATVAARWGFVSPAHFSHAFRKAYGMSPAQFRGQGPDG
ncbi:helix-turn-helix domain-containing protein [Streptomyces sp. MBT65]|uniref:helix-turn-helix domain-containing protein n=1 Tax=Streptomyces sp. MBT65 TaxID=1488395 RepID=UPI0019098961|nr:helix-turn-helix domain-containing protein [Streptomyces sp. MBT65]MBK3577704.1 helix-turn-helix domain-containing protein [Streptomyces sp. MBT65]